MEQSDDIIGQYPVLAPGLILGVAAAAYAVVSFVMRQTVDPLEVGLFAVVFAVVYVGFAVYADSIESAVGSN
ncbi:hypothetical protein [Salinibaculum rarum]|uniref:hypothetical protein n=1 Tax=Salinibaculum rarum TaxID=3058903 RepID=UPI00265ED777|nr:hypothetical protein [Salinibaculum sp. KK48]